MSATAQTRGAGVDSGAENRVGPAPDAGGAAGVRIIMHDPETPQGQLGLAFKRAMVAMRRLRGRETHRPGQLSYAQYGLLHHLGQGGGLSARELADLADLTPATVTQMLDSLESAALITRTRSEADRRVVLSCLTDTGAELICLRQEQLEPRWRAALGDFSDEEMLTAARVLDRLAAMFDAMLEDPPPTS